MKDLVRSLLDVWNQIKEELNDFANSLK